MRQPTVHEIAPPETGFALTGDGFDLHRYHLLAPVSTATVLPELPEVETTRRGIEPYAAGQRVRRLVVREPRLRWPVPPDLAERMKGQTIATVRRRAKYLLLDFDRGSALLHLGMSGSLRVHTRPQPPQRHDHVDFELESGVVLRLTDPRRFGCLLWAGAQPMAHPLLASLGPEPLDDDFTGQWLWRRARGRRGAVKSFLMDQRTVVGVGNIYASEALFLAGIHPSRPAGRISQARYERLEKCVRQVLCRAIEAGGTTLRDFVDSDGQPGYFSQSLLVYGRDGQACPGCGQPLRRRVIGQRATFYCARCQR